MTPLTANLRHLYQYWVMCPMYALLVLMSLFPVIVRHNRLAIEHGMFAYPLLVAFIAGTLMSHHVLAIMASPFTFCLPGHQKVTRQFVVIAGVVISAVLSLVFLAYPALPRPLRLTALIWAFSSNLAVYGFGSQFTVFSPLSKTMIGPLIGWSWLLALVVVYFDGHIAIVNAIIEANPLFLGACLVLAVYALSYWGKRDVARGFCGSWKLNGLNAWNAETIRAATQERWAARPTRPNWITAWIERFFLNRMTAHRPLSRAKSIWGGVYATYGGIGSGWKGLVFMIVICALYFGYLGVQASWYVFVFGSVILGFTIQLPVYSTLSVPSGRQERFFIAIGMAFTGCVFSITILGGAVLLTHLVTPYAPALTLKDHVLRFQPMRPLGLWIPVVVVPLLQAIRLFWPKRWLIPFMILFPVMSFFMMAMISTRELIPSWVLPTAIGVVALSWSIFLAVLHRVCFRRDLVVQ